MTHLMLELKIAVRLEGATARSRRNWGSRSDLFLGVIFFLVYRLETQSLDLVWISSEWWVSLISVVFFVWMDFWDSRSWLMFLLVILSCIPYLPFMSDPCRRHVEDMFLFGRLRFSNRDFKKINANIPIKVILMT